MKLEEKLVSLRKAKGLSQMKLAEMMNVSRQAISRWEVGTAVPSTDNLIYLGRLYNVPLEYLLHDDAPEPVPQGTSEAEAGRGTTRQVLMFIAIIVVAAFICAGIFRNESQEAVLMNEIERSEVETEQTNDFELDF